MLYKQKAMLKKLLGEHIQLAKKNGEKNLENTDTDIILTGNKSRKFSVAFFHLTTDHDCLMAH